MITAKELRAWLKGMPADTKIGVDDDSLIARKPGSSGWEEELTVGELPAVDDEEEDD